MVSSRKACLVSSSADGWASATAATAASSPDTYTRKSRPLGRRSSNAARSTNEPPTHSAPSEYRARTSKVRVPVATVTSTSDPIVHPSSEAWSVEAAMPSSPSESRSPCTSPRSNRSPTVAAVNACSIRSAPATWAPVTRVSRTASMPAVDWSSSAMSVDSPPLPSKAPESKTWVPRNVVASDPPNDVRAEAARTAMNTTRATPIMSDEAVRAVRLGLRWALRRAISPGIPRSRSGWPMARITGRASTGASTAIPIMMTKAPRPTRLMPEPPRPASRARTPRAVTTVPVVVRRIEAPGRSMATSRIAAMGGTRPARRAGIHADTIVTTMPIEADTAIEPAWTTMGASGSSTPAAPSRARRPIETPRPATSPAPAPKTAIAAASPSTALSTWRRLAPTARSMASCWVRWATVIENVLLMRNAPTSIATTAKTSRNTLNGPKASANRARSSALSTSAVTTSTSSGTRGSMRDASSAADVPSAAVMVIPSTRPWSASSAWAAASVKRTVLAPAGESAVPKVATPTISTSEAPRWVMTVVRSPGSKPATVAVWRSITTSLAAAGARPAAIR